MSCEDFGPDLSAFADGELDGDAFARVQAHLKGCADCRRALETWREAGRRLRAEDETSNEATRFRSAVRRRQLADSGRGPRRWRWWLAAAAALFLVAPALFYRQALADREVREIVDLEGRNRADTITQIRSVDALQLDVGALLVRARAAGLEAKRLQELDVEARAVAEEAERVRARLMQIQENLNSEGLLGEIQEVSREAEDR